MEQKRCNECGLTKPVGDFHLLRKDKTWRAAYCIPCERIRAREYQKDHRLDGNARVLLWVERHPFQARITVMERQARYQWKKAGLHYEKFSYFDVLERDGWVCSICGEKVEECALSFDHVIPKLAGGPHTFENVRVAHIRCNESKGGKAAASVRWQGRGTNPTHCKTTGCPIHSLKE